MSFCDELPIFRTDRQRRRVRLSSADLHPETRLHGWTFWAAPWLVEDQPLSAREDAFEVFDGGKGVVEVMEQRLPALIFRGLPKADGVIFEAVPLDEKQVLVLVFEATLQLVRNVSGAGSEDGLGLGKCLFEGGALAGPNVEDGEFENHGLLSRNSTLNLESVLVF